jgi:flagellar hook-associated protein FlgK
MTQSFNNVYEEMESLWHEQNDSINTVAQKINSIAQKLAQLNDSIAGALQTGGTANDLNDERNLLLDELSGYVNITYSLNTSNDNMIDVRIGGLTLVEGKTANEIEVESAASHTSQIDDLAQQIADLNAASETETDPAVIAANRDAIDVLVIELGNYVTVAAADNTDNPALIDVTFDGVPFVTGTEPFPAAAAVKSDLDTFIAFNRNNLTLNGMELSNDNNTVTSGQLYSNMEMITSKSPLSPGIPYIWTSSTFLSGKWRRA